MGVLDDTFRMPEVDPGDSGQNAFVIDWLVAWAKEHTVYGSADWRDEARKWVYDTRADWAKEWGVTVESLIKDAQMFEALIDEVQETYNYAKDRMVRPDGSRSSDC